MLALLLTRGIKATNLFRTVFFMPNLIGGIVLGYIWQIIINGVLIKFGVDITFSAKYGFWGLVVLMNWQMAGCPHDDNIYSGASEYSGRPEGSC